MCLHQAPNYAYMIGHRHRWICESVENLALFHDKSYDLDGGSLCIPQLEPSDNRILEAPVSPGESGEKGFVHSSHAGKITNTLFNLKV